ncbi:MAG: hypothetical protein LBG16_05115 [Elusimicrobiota bacterium]|jgi:hypothetical protein|nr:hypothetical protein [Elusimicrobiota bacterium]
MDITKVKRERLGKSETLKISLYVWAKTAGGAAQALLLGLLASAAAAAPWTVFAPYARRPYILWCAAATNIFLALVYVTLALALLRAAYDILNTKQLFMIDCIDKALRALPKLFAALAAAGAACYALSFLRPAGGAAVFAAYIGVIAVWTAVIALYFGFYCMSLLFRGSGIFATFRFTFLLLKGKWATAFFRTLFGLLLAALAEAVFTAALSGGVYWIFSEALSDTLDSVRAMGLFAVFYHGAELWLPAAVFCGAWALGSVMVWTFLSSYMTVLFLNTELSSEPDPSQSKIEILPAGATAPAGEHEFTEFFRIAKAVDVTERIVENADTLPALAPRTREDALREFGREEENDARADYFEDLPDDSPADEEGEELMQVLRDIKTDRRSDDRDNLPSSILKDK